MTQVIQLVAPTLSAVVIVMRKEVDKRKNEFRVNNKENPGP